MEIKLFCDARSCLCIVIDVGAPHTSTSTKKDKNVIKYSCDEEKWYRNSCEMRSHRVIRFLSHGIPLEEEEGRFRLDSCTVWVWDDAMPLTLLRWLLIHHRRWPHSITFIAEIIQTNEPREKRERRRERFGKTKRNFTFHSEATRTNMLSLLIEFICFLNESHNCLTLIRLHRKTNFSFCFANLQFVFFLCFLLIAVATTLTKLPTSLMHLKLNWVRSYRTELYRFTIEKIIL